MSDTDYPNKPIYEYDVALSFAGEDREYVEDTALILRGYGVKVFYDKFEEADLWGKDLFTHLKEIYSKRAKYTIMFISKHYKNKLWTTHERKSMQERAFRESEEYILPARFDNTEIPGLYETIGYIDLRTKTPSELTDLVLKKLKWKISNRWWGNWILSSHRTLYHGELFISQVDEDGLNFSLYNLNGAHTGEVEGKAIFKSENEALFTSERHEDWFEHECIIKFTKTNDIIQIIENQCSYYHGMQSHFGGDYFLQKDVFFDLSLNDKILSNLYKQISDKYWSILLKCFSTIYEDDYNYLNKMRIIHGASPGLFTIQEGLLAISEKDEAWGGFIDDEKVYYFSSNENMSFPKDVIDWLSKHTDMPLILI